MFAFLRAVVAKYSFAQEMVRDVAALGPAIVRTVRRLSR